jgi:flagellar motor switch protein FliM
LGDIVSQEEIDSLLEGMESYGHSSHTVPEHLRFLHTLHEEMAHLFSKVLSRLTHTHVSVEFEGIEESSLPQSTSAYHIYFGVESLMECASIEIDRNLTFGLLERMLGGADEAWEERKEFSEIEQALLETLSEELVGVVCRVYKDSTQGKIIRKTKRYSACEQRFVGRMRVCVGRSCEDILVAYPLKLLEQISADTLGSAPMTASHLKSTVVRVIENGCMNAFGNLMTQRPFVSFDTEVDIAAYVPSPAVAVKMIFNANMSAQGLMLIPSSLVAALETQMFGMQSSESLDEETLKIIHKIASDIFEEISRGFSVESTLPSLAVKVLDVHHMDTEMDLQRYAKMYVFKVSFDTFSSHLMFAVDDVMAVMWMENDTKEQVW